MHNDFIIIILLSQTGLNGNYTFQVHGDTDDIRTHMVKFNIKTPLDFLKDFRTSAIMEIDGDLYNATVTILGNDLIMGLSGKMRVSFAH